MGTRIARYYYTILGKLNFRKKNFGFTRHCSSHRKGNHQTEVGRLEIQETLFIDNRNREGRDHVGQCQQPQRGPCHFPKQREQSQTFSFKKKITCRQRRGTKKNQVFSSREQI
ncbi:hypothetical protein AAHE18_08G061100 [Arachis hypogaea]